MRLALLNLKGGAAKCLVGTSRITNPVTGVPWTLEEVMADPSFDHVYTVDVAGGGQVRKAPIGAKVDSGVQETVRICFASGREVVTTLNHPFLMPDGWRQADQISVGETAALPARLPAPHKTRPVDHAELTLLALLLAEGSCAGVGTRFTTASPELLKLVKASAQELGIEVKPLKGSTIDYQLSGGHPLPIKRGYCHCGCGEKTALQTVNNKGAGLVKGQPNRFLSSHGTSQLNTLQALRRRHGLDLVKSKDKQLPPAIYSLPDEHLSWFLAVLWMCDGYVSSFPAITLASESFVRDLQHVLLRFGIQSRVRPKASRLNGKTFLSWELGVFSHCWERFAEKVPLWGHKRERLLELLARQAGGPARTHNIGDPSCPPQLRSFLYSLSPQGKARARGLPRLADVATRLGWGRFQFDLLFQRKTGSLSRRTLREYCAVFGGGEELQHLWSEDIFWDKVVTIEPAGRRQVYDLCVPETHCFIADDVVVHNTTSAFFLANELSKRGRTLFIDTDPQGSALSWSVMAGTDPEEGGLPFPVIALPVEDVHKRLEQVSSGYEHVVIDTPPGHIKIVRSVLMACDVAVIPISSSMVEIDRLRPTLELMADVEGLSDFDVHLLFTRLRHWTNSAKAASTFLVEQMQLPVLETFIPYREQYVTAFGALPSRSEEYADVLRELMGERPLSEPKALNLEEGEESAPAPADESPADGAAGSATPLTGDDVGTVEVMTADDLVAEPAVAAVDEVIDVAGPLTEDELGEVDLMHRNGWGIAEAEEEVRARRQERAGGEADMVEEEVEIRDDSEGYLEPARVVEELPAGDSADSADRTEDAEAVVAIALERDVAQVEGVVEVDEADEVADTGELMRQADERRRVLEARAAEDLAATPQQEAAPSPAEDPAEAVSLSDVLGPRPSLDFTPLLNEEDDSLPLGRASADAELHPGPAHSSVDPRLGLIGDEDLTDPTETGEMAGEMTGALPARDASGELCVPYHYWQVDWNVADEGHYLHRCSNCGREVMAATIDEATAAAAREDRAQTDRDGEGPDA